MTDKRWGIYIDIEGFSKKFSIDGTDAEGNDQESAQDLSGLLSLNALMEGIFLIGTKKYTDDIERLFAHQFGDAFVIVSCFEERDLSRPLAITVSLMRHVLASGGVAKASIAEGGFGDIKSCYPEAIVESQDNGLLSMGRGVMTIIPVMGTVLINCVKIDKLSPSGSLVTIDSANRERIPSDYQVQKIDDGFLSINWLKGEPDLVTEICAHAGLKNPPEQERIESLKEYIRTNKMEKKEWGKNTCREQDVDL